MHTTQASHEYSLEQEGIPTPSEYYRQLGLWPDSRPHSPIWRMSTIGRILQKPVYWGEYVAFRNTVVERRSVNPVTGRVRKTRTIAFREFDEATASIEWSEERGHTPVFLPSAAPPIVPKELAIQVHAVLKRNKAEAAKHPKGDDREDRVLRGGSWDSSAQIVRVACRHVYRPSAAEYDVGVRLARGGVTNSITATLFFG